MMFFIKRKVFIPLFYRFYMGIKTRTYATEDDRDSLLIDNAPFWEATEFCIRDSEVIRRAMNKIESTYRDHQLSLEEKCYLIQGVLVDYESGPGIENIVVFQAEDTNVSGMQRAEELLDLKST